MASREQSLGFSRTMSRVKVQAFVPSWPGEKQHPQELVNVMSPHCPVSVLDNPEHYFTEQWEEMRSKFFGSIMLWVMADVTLHDFPKMYAECIRVLSRPDVGIYAPNVCWTGHIYDMSTLVKIEDGVYDVPMTDVLCYAVRSDVLEKLMHIRREKHGKMGWGIELLLTVIAKRMGRKNARDYRFLVDHPNSTSYDIGEASEGMTALIADSGMYDDIHEVLAQRDQKRIKE
jgi:hypothetical protein